MNIEINNNYLPIEFASLAPSIDVCTYFFVKLEQDLTPNIFLAKASFKIIKIKTASENSTKLRLFARL